MTKKVRHVSISLTFATPANEHVVLAEVTNHLLPMQAYHLISAHTHEYEIDDYEE